MRANQCCTCGAEMPEGDQVCARCRGTVKETLTVPTVSPWMKTSDRLPTEADAGVDEEILTIYDDGETRVMGTDYWAYVAKVPERFPYWLPVPKLPEVEG